MTQRNKKRILLIEDEPEQAMMIKFRLEANNLEVVVACNGKEGMEKACGENPDLILLDVVMPQINGYETCKYLKQDPRTQNIPTIIFTASVPRDIREKCLEAGADDYIIRPSDSDVLLKKVKYWLNK